MSLVTMMAPFAQGSGKISSPVGTPDTASVVMMPDSNGRTLLRSFVQPANPNTFQQEVFRGFFSQVQEAIQSLTIEEVASWRTLAENITRSGRLGIEYTLSWTMAYSMVNNLRLQNGQTVIDTAPLWNPAPLVGSVTTLASDDGAPAQEVDVTFSCRFPTTSYGSSPRTPKVPGPRPPRATRRSCPSPPPASTSPPASATPWRCSTLTRITSRAPAPSSGTSSAPRPNQPTPVERSLKRSPLRGQPNHARPISPPTADRRPEHPALGRSRGTISTAKAPEESRTARNRGDRLRRLTVYARAQDAVGSNPSRSRPRRPVPNAVGVHMHSDQLRLALQPSFDHALNVIQVSALDGTRTPGPRPHAAARDDYFQGVALPVVTDLAFSASLLDPPRNSVQKPVGGSIGSTLEIEDDLAVVLLGAGPTEATARLRGALAINYAIGSPTAQRYLRCGQDAYVYALVAGGEVHRAKITRNWCKCRACYACQRRLAHTVAPRIEAIVRAMQWPTMITLTLRHDEGDSLRELLTQLQSSWLRLTRTSIWKSVRGGVKILEVKHGDNGWHPHLHAIVDCKWIARDALRAEWSRITGGSYMVDVRRVSDAAEAAGYVAKYTTKTESFTDFATLTEYAAAMHGKRTMSTFGEWSKVSLARAEDALPDRDDPGDDTLRPYGRMSTILRAARHGDRVAMLIAAYITGRDEYLPPEPPRAPPDPQQSFA
jgi:hypothetical protein